jgi:hypothetical protein
MKFLKLFSLFFLAVLLCSAETLTLTGNGQSNDGVDYTGFYPLTLTDGSSTIDFNAPCIFDGTNITVGEHWNVELLSLDNYDTAVGLSPDQGQEVAYLYGLFQTKSAPSVSDAIWTITDGSTITGKSGFVDNNADNIYGAGSVQNLITLAENNYTSANLSDFEVWAPINSHGKVDLSLAQPFLVQSPEPLTLAFVGAGLLALGYKRRLV